MSIYWPQSLMTLRQKWPRGELDSLTAIATERCDGKDASEGSVHPFGPLPGTDPIGNKTGIGVAMTTCRDSGEECHGVPLLLVNLWIQIFGKKDPEYDYQNMFLKDC